MSLATQARVSANLRRARTYRLPATLTHDEWTRTLADFHGLCAYCEAAPAAVLEHFVPISRGGGTTAGNCLPACIECDDSKGGRAPEARLPARRLSALRSYLAARSTGQDTGTPAPDSRRVLVNVPEATLAAMDETVDALQRDPIHHSMTRTALILAGIELALKKYGPRP